MLLGLHLTSTGDRSLSSPSPQTHPHALILELPKTLM